MDGKGLAANATSKKYSIAQSGVFRVVTMPHPERKPSFLVFREY
jgi:hypothetical protein